MRLAPRQSTPLGPAWRLVLGLALCCVPPHRLLAKDDQTKGLSPGVARVLRWLPEDTETLVVARSVTLPDPGGAPDWQSFGLGLACEDLSLESGKPFELKPPRGRKIECIVRGARNFESVSSFGSLRSESCAIIVFENDLGDAGRKWTESLRKAAKAVRSLVGREVFVFPSTTIMEPWFKETEWQGTYLVLLKPNVVLCATSDRYLESVLRRANEAPRSRALPDNLPEWKQVDFDAPVWMLRHIPIVGARDHTVGLTATFTRNGFRVAYIAKTGSDLNFKQIKEDWLPDDLFDTQVLRDQLKTVRQADGTVVLSCGEKLGEGTLSFGLRLYWLQAIGLSDPGE